jgi:undecaprenyl-diphosphatase
MLDMLYFCSIIVLQIVLESFPVSSSGHNILLERLWKKIGYLLYIKHPLETQRIIGLEPEIIHMLHGPTLVVLFVVFYHDLVSWIPIAVRNKKFLLLLLLQILYADSITSFFYLLFKHIGTSWFPLSLGFAATACALYGLRYCTKTTTTLHPLGIASVFGVVQGIALLPGLSRFGTTFVAARWLGFVPPHALKISMMLEVPLLAGACARSAYLLYLTNTYGVFIKLWPACCIILATFMSIISMFWIKKLVQTERLWLFSFYLVIPACIALFV